jgi:hypothetical protein
MSGRADELRSGVRPALAAGRTGSEAGAANANGGADELSSGPTRCAFAAALTAPPYLVSSVWSGAPSLACSTWSVAASFGADAAGWS